MEEIISKNKRFLIDITFVFFNEVFIFFNEVKRIEAYLI